MSEHIKVAIRVRPFLPHETPFGCVRTTETQVMVGESRCFAFDTVFDMGASPDDVYVAIGQPLANSFLDGFNVSTIAYGQTGAGKTFTMGALSNDVVQEIFCRLQEDTAQAQEKQNGDTAFTLRMSALEVYNEHVGDLLHSKGPFLRHVAGVVAVTAASSSAPSPTNADKGSGAAPPRQRKASTAPSAHNSPVGAGGPALPLREDPKGGVYVAGLTEMEVRTEEALLACIESATANRKTATTLMNATSSRSHCVVTLTLQRRGVVSRCCFVDLAGSERFKKSLGVGMDPTMGAALAKAANSGYGIPLHTNSSTSSNDAPAGGDGVGQMVMDRMREGISINGGLLALGNVIVALCEKKAHVPYRSSKLTRLLQPMLGGNSRTAMVACISPLEASIEETLNTLKYANRAKSIKTSPHLVPAVPSLFMSPEEAERAVLALRKELEDVQNQLAVALSANTRSQRGNSSFGQRWPQPRSNSIAADANGGGKDVNRGRRRAQSRPPPAKGSGGANPASSDAPFPPSRSSSTPGHAPDSRGRGAAATTAGTADLLKQISDLKMQLTQERNVTKRLEEDLFSAEYTAMVEVEKRRAAEERVLELEALQTPNTADDGVPSSTSSCSDSPRTRLTTNMALLKKLEEERDSLQALKAKREQDKARLNAALSTGPAGASTSGATAGAHGNGSAAASPKGLGNTSMVSDPALAELSADIESKTQQVAVLERQNEEIVTQLHTYERALAEAGSEKARLQDELAKAEELLERSELDRQQKETEKARLQAEFREKVRRAEEKATDYRRRVKRAEQDMKMRALNAQRIGLLRQEVGKLRDEAARQKANRRADHMKGAQQSVAHAHEVALLQRQLRETEQQMTRLQSNLQRKEGEIARIKAKVVPAATPGQAQPAQGVSTVRLAAPLPPSNVSSSQQQYPSPTGDNNMSTSADIQSQIDSEVQKLGRLEKELQELQECRRVLAQTQSRDAPKYQSALLGFRKRLHRIDADLTADDANVRPTPFTAEQREQLEKERVDIRIKLAQLEAFQKMFDEAKQQLEEFDDRIDSLNETRKYHLHRVRRLQHRRTDSANTACSSTGTSPVHGASAATAAPAAPGTSPSTAPPPSVREIATARRRNRWAGPYQPMCTFLEGVPSSLRGNEPAGAAAGSHNNDNSLSSISTNNESALESKAKASQRRYVRQLEEMVEVLKKETETLRAQVAHAS